jgi:hypothetical protein
MKRLSVLLVLVSVLFAQSRCATGIEPPRTTALVEVTEGLIFTFGQEKICWNAQEMGGLNKEIAPGGCEDGKEIPFIPPTTQVQLTSFAIEQHEVSNVQYEYCVSLGECTAPTGYNAPGPRQNDYYEIDEFDDYPVMFVSRFQAQEYCTFVGRRLPTELEWDRVARGNPDQFGGGKRAVPSDAFDSLNGCKGSNIAGPFCGTSSDTVPVDQPGDDYVMEGAQKIHHLFSNVSEWTGDAYDVLRTCKDSLPDDCSSIFGCANLVNDLDWDEDRKPEDPDYKTYVEAHPRTMCQQSAKKCDGCDALDLTQEICHEGCAGEPRSYLTCVTWSKAAQPVAASELETAADLYGVVRGGSVITLDNTSCRFNSDYRGSSTQVAISSSAPALGFRCAVDL